MMTKIQVIVMHQTDNSKEINRSLEKYDNPLADLVHSLYILILCKEKVTESFQTT